MRLAIEVLLVLVVAFVALLFTHPGVVVTVIGLVLAWKFLLRPMVRRMVSGGGR